MRLDLVFYLDCFSLFFSFVVFFIDTLHQNILRVAHLFEMWHFFFILNNLFLRQRQFLITRKIPYIFHSIIGTRHSIKRTNLIRLSEFSINWVPTFDESYWLDEKNLCKLQSQEIPFNKHLKKISIHTHDCNEKCLPELWN